MFDVRVRRGGPTTVAASSAGGAGGAAGAPLVPGPLLHGEVCGLPGLPAPDVSSCLPPLVVKLVSEPSCVRFLTFASFLSSSAIRDISVSLVIYLTNRYVTIAEILAI